MSVQPRLATAFWLMSMTDRPRTRATVSPLLTMIRPPVIGFDCARWALKWFWLVLQVSWVNQVESASEMVRPIGCW
jgi:hypothetical protein